MCVCVCGGSFVADTRSLCFQSVVFRRHLLQVTGSSKHTDPTRPLADGPCFPYAVTLYVCVCVVVVVVGDNSTEESLRQTFPLEARCGPIPHKNHVCPRKVVAKPALESGPETVPGEQNQF